MPSKYESLALHAASAFCPAINDPPNEIRDIESIFVPPPPQESNIADEIILDNTIHSFTITAHHWLVTLSRFFNL
jgi:hypothetical protein